MKYALAFIICFSLINPAEALTLTGGIQKNKYPCMDVFQRGLRELLLPCEVKTILMERMRLTDPSKRVRMWKRVQANELIFLTRRQLREIETLAEISGLDLR